MGFKDCSSHLSGMILNSVPYSCLSLAFLARPTTYPMLMADHNGLMSHNGLEELPPPVTHPTTPLFRQPTRNDTLISSQSSDEDRFDTKLARKVTLDTLERSFSAKSEDRQIKDLKNDYSDFKSRPSSHFFHDVVSILTSSLPSTRRVCYPPLQAVNSEETFSDCIENLNLALREGADTECVRTWFESQKSWELLNTNAYPSVVSMHSEAYKLYSFRKMFLTTAKSNQRKQEAPVKAILHLIGQEWNLSGAVMGPLFGTAAPKQGFPRIKRPSIGDYQC